MKRFALILTAFLFSLGTHAQQHSVQIQPPRPKVGVVLSGGGAKGASHIGVLKYLEEIGVPVDYVAGTSMGSIIGGLYAMGYSPDELGNLIANMNWSEYVGNRIDRLVMSPEMRYRNGTYIINIPFSVGGIFKKKMERQLPVSFLPSAYVNNTELINLFNDLCIGYQEEMDFNNLPIPFACVATNITTGKEVIIRQGSVPTAMRASMAIPGVFSPVLMNHMVLVDGGLVNNFPADVLREMGADIIIGVEVSDKQENELNEIPALPLVLNYLINNATNSKREENRKLCNVHLCPDITGYGMLSFTPSAIDSLVRRGYKEATEHHDQLLSIKQHLDSIAGHPVSKELHAPRARNLKDEPIIISSITMNQSNIEQSKWLSKKGGLKMGEPVSAKDIDRAVSIFRGTGAFNDITYNIYENHFELPTDTIQTYKLILNFKPTQPHVVGIGTRYDTEEGAAMLINLGINEKRLSGFKLNLTGRLSYNPRLNVTATYSLIPVANFNLAYDFRSQHFKVMVQDIHRNTNLHYVQSQVSSYISQFQLFNINTSLGFAYTATHFDQTFLGINISDTLGIVMTQTSDFDDNKLFGPYLNLNFDNMDHSYFARNGINASLNTRLYLDPANPRSAVQDLAISFEGYITPKNGKFTIIPQFYGRMVFGKPLYANLWNAIGGDIPGRHVDQQMPFIGVSHLNETSDRSAIARCDLRYNFYGKHYLTATYNILLGYNKYNYDRGTLDLEHYSGVGLRYAYNSPIGPIALTAQWSNCTREFSMYFSLGYNF
jgi:NTE family protein